MDEMEAGTGRGVARQKREERYQNCRRALKARWHKPMTMVNQTRREWETSLQPATDPVTRPSWTGSIHQLCATRSEQLHCRRLGVRRSPEKTSPTFGSAIANSVTVTKRPAMKAEAIKRKAISHGCKFKTLIIDRLAIMLMVGLLLLN